MALLLLLVLLSLTRQIDARCKHHLSCSECVSDSKCQWSLFSAVHTSSSRKVNSNECHARPTLFHGKTAKQFPVRPGSDETDIPISWAKDIEECPPDVTKEQYESVRGLSVLDAVSMLRPTETKEKPNSVRIPMMVLRLARYIITMTTPSSLSFTAYVVISLTRKNNTHINVTKFSTRTQVRASASRDENRDDERRLSYTE